MACQSYMIFVILTTILATILYCQRRHITITVIAMADTENNTSIQQLCGEDTTVKTEFKWTPIQQSVILTVPMYGMVLTAFPGGYFADRIGGKSILTLSIIVSTIVTFLSPAALRWDIRSFYLVQFLEGCSGGCLWPAVNTMVMKRVPVRYRTTCIIINYSGIPLAYIISPIISAALSCSIGWSAVYYAFGVSGVLVTLIWVAIIKNSPLEAANESNSVKRKQDIPWRKMFVSRLFVVLTFAWFCNTFYGTFLQFEVPTFFNDNLHVNLYSNGAFSGLSYIGPMIVGPMMAIIVDHVISRGIFSITVTRKLVYVSSLLPSAILMFLATYTTERHWLTVACITLVNILFECGYSGINMSFVDVTENYSGVYSGVALSYSYTAYIVQATLMGYMVTDSRTTAQYRMLYLMMSPVAAAGMCLYYGYSLCRYFQPYTPPPLYIDLSLYIQYWLIKEIKRTRFRLDL